MSNKKCKIPKNKRIEKGKKDVGGRPRIHSIDWDELKRLAECRNTAADCAYIFGMSVDTLDRHLQDKFGYGYAEFFKRNFIYSGARLRKEMYELAVEQKNVTMMIWLSKNWLGMKEPETKTQSENNTVIKLAYSKDELDGKK